jgi:hypothetical protein
MVSIEGWEQPAWQLFDTLNDPGEKTDVAAAHPAIVQRLAAAYDQWWDEMRPLLVNEDAPLPELNPFKELYWEQFGGGPSAEDLDAMNPEKFFARQKAPKKKD